MSEKEQENPGLLDPASRARANLALEIVRLRDENALLREKLEACQRERDAAFERAIEVAR